MIVAKKVTYWTTNSSGHILLMWCDLNPLLGVYYTSLKGMCIEVFPYEKLTKVPHQQNQIKLDMVSL